MATIAGERSTLKGGEIITNLQNFPLVSQLTTITSDGRPSENAPYDCVAASIGAAILWYEDKSQWDQDINPDKLKDAAYGENWKNQGTAASAYVSYCASLGYKLSSISGLVGQLPELAHQYLAKNLPVIFTERDPYVPASYGWSHVCVWYSDSAGELTALDPYIGKPITRTDQEWVTELIGNELWIVEKIQEDQPMPITINSPEASGFKELDASHWQCISNGHIIQYGLLADYKQRGYSFLGIPWSDEYTLAEGWAIQFYRYGVRQWRNGVVSSVDLYTPGSPGRDPQLIAQIKQLQAQLAQQPPSQAQAILDKIKLDVPQAQAGLDKLKADLGI